MKALVALFSLSVLVSACTAAFHAKSAIGLGRQEMFRGQHQDALESFEVALERIRSFGLTTIARRAF